MNTVFYFPSSKSSKMHNSRNTGVHIATLSYTEIKPRKAPLEIPNICPFLATIQLNFLYSRQFIAQTLTLFLCWTCVSFSSYALSFAVAELSGDIVLNTVYGMLADLPNCLIIFFVIDNLGRKKSLAGSLFLVGASCMALAAIPKMYSNVVLVIYLFGKVSEQKQLQHVIVVVSSDRNTGIPVPVFSRFP